MSALNAQSGEEPWRFDTDHFLSEPILSNGGDIFLTCFDDTVYGLGVNGYGEDKQSTGVEDMVDKVAA